MFTVGGIRVWGEEEVGAHLPQAHTGQLRQAWLHLRVQGDHEIDNNNTASYEIIYENVVAVLIFGKSFKFRSSATFTNAYEFSWHKIHPYLIRFHYECE